MGGCQGVGVSDKLDDIGAVGAERKIGVLAHWRRFGRVGAGGCVAMFGSRVRILLCPMHGLDLVCGSCCVSCTVWMLCADLVVSYARTGLVVVCRSCCVSCTV